MLCHWLYHITSIDLFDGRLFRAGVAAMLSIVLVLFFMPKYISLLQGLDATSDFDKDGKTKSPPIMGGLLLVVVVEVVSLLVCKMNGYTISTLVILAAFSAVGAIDDIARRHFQQPAPVPLLPVQPDRRDFLLQVHPRAQGRPHHPLLPHRNIPATPPQLDFCRLHDVRHRG